jgi:hypothetical protein
MSIVIRAPADLGIRGTDAHGSGEFGAPRSRGSAGASWAVKRYEHKGVDFIVVPGQNVICPCDAWVTRYGQAYAGDDRYGSIHMDSVDDPDFSLKLFYAQLVIEGALPVRVGAGAPFAIAQDLRLRYNGIVPHVHLECRRLGVLVNPMDLLVRAA